MNSFKVRLKAWIKNMLRPAARPLKRWAKPYYLRLRTGASAVRAHYQVGTLLPVLERAVETLRHEREQSDQLILALYRTLNYPPVAAEKLKLIPFAVALGGQRLLVAHPHAPFILLDSEDLQDTPRMVMNHYEPGVSLAIRQLLRPGDFAVDLGAAPGIQTLTMATAVGGRGRVHAFVRDRQEQHWLETNLVSTGLSMQASCWLDRDWMTTIEDVGRAPDLIRVGSAEEQAKLSILLSENVLPLSGRILFRWKATDGASSFARALKEAGLNFWNIDGEGTLFRTTWDEMRSRGCESDAYYIAARTLE